MQTKIAVFDLETRLDAKDLAPEPMEEERGWRLLREGEGGVSALAIYDSVEQWTYFYDEHSIQSAAAHLESCTAIIGFYSKNFDVPVIEGLLGRKLRIKYHYDIYAEVVKANAVLGIVGTKGDFKLDSICRRTLGRGKNGHGSQAATLFKEGKYGQLFNYCSLDVKLTRDLFYHICKEGGVINISNKFLPLSVPEWLSAAINRS